jgi:hypothetical protein
VLGFRHANATAGGGEAAAMALLDHLALHPATARRIATKLCVRFVADEPPAALVTRLAKVYLDHKTAIAPVLRALFTSAEFAARSGRRPGPVRGRRRHGPHARLRAREAGHGHQALYWLIQSAGQAPMAWAPPNGYPDVASRLAVAVRQVISAGTPPATSPPAGGRARCSGRRWSPRRRDACPATYGALIDARRHRGCSAARCRPHTAALAAFYGKTPPRPEGRATARRLAFCTCRPCCSTLPTSR